ncbi:MAG: hypothetical protein DCF20_20735 [Pseudanabaena sp.]|nr:MAG: hypothetical protein DCF20_20735 [Pseudanabaena sp.]
MSDNSEIVPTFVPIYLLGRQCLFLPFDKVGFIFSAISCQSWQFPILTARKSAFSPYLVPAS